MTASRSTDATSDALPAAAGARVGAVAKSTRPREAWWFLGPAFVASVAYMDPGNFATNIEGGARFGYQLLWVLLWSNAMAILVQYLAAKLGIATGKTLPENCRELYSRPVTVMLWVAAEIAAMATDLAEFLGAALGFYLLFGMPMLPAAIVTGVVVMLILMIEQAGFQWLERVIMAFVAVIGIAYAWEVFISKPQWGAIANNVIIPRATSSSIYIAVSMLGATVMPHVIYLHSALVLPRREERDRHEHHHRKMELFDVLLAMNGAWLINSAMLIMAAAVFFGHGLAVYSIQAAHETLGPLLGRFAGIAFAVALLASGISSSSVGTMAGQVILQGFLQVRISIFTRRDFDHDSRDPRDCLGARSSEDARAEPSGVEFLPAFRHDSLAADDAAARFDGQPRESQTYDGARGCDYCDRTGAERLAAFLARRRECLNLANRTGATVGLFILLVAIVVAVIFFATSEGSWNAPPDAIAQPNPIPPTLTALAAGKAIYTARCAGCHGESGRREGNEAARLRDEAGGLTRCEIDAGDERRRALLEDNQRASPMPSFREKIERRRALGSD